jgi:hypothetical protein
MTETMNTFFIIIIVLAAVYGFAAVGYYYAFKNWKPMCGSRKSSAESEKTIQWLLSKQSDGKNDERS